MSFFCKEKIFNLFLHFSGIMLKFAASLVLANASDLRSNEPISG